MTRMAQRSICKLQRLLRNNIEIWPMEDTRECFVIMPFGDAEGYDISRFQGGLGILTDYMPE